MLQFLEAARVLGLDSQAKPLTSDILYLDMIENGLPLETLDRICVRVSPSEPNFKYRIVPKASLARRKAAKRLSTDQSVVVARLAAVWTMAVGIWKSEEGSRDFLTRAHQMLGNRRPLDLVLENEIGADLVKSVLGRLANGSAV